MDLWRRFCIILAILVYLVAVTESQGGLSSGSGTDVKVGTGSRVQTATCAYKPARTDDGEINNLFGDRGSQINLNNGSVLCQVEDDEVILLCMSVMKMENVTDEYGNITRTLTVKVQDCFTKEAGDYTDCSGPDEKCSDTLSKGKPGKEGFCCCSGVHCNRKDNLELLPYVEVSTTPALGSDEDNSNTNAVIIVASILTPLLVISLIIVAVFYVCRRNRQRKEIALQSKIAQYNEMRMYSNEPPDVNYDDMKLEVCLHRGRFGDVYKAKLNDDDACVKYFHAQQRNLFLTEKEIYEILDPNVRTVVQCMACDERTHPDGSVQYMVIMEYLPYGSLAAYLKTHVLTWRDMCSMAKSAANGLGYLHGETFINRVHKHAVVHRDINSRNILVRGDMTCAIADMGFSMKIRGSKIIKQGVEEHAADGSLRDVGTVRYMAPEILDCAVNLRDCESSLKQIDMYAFSLVLWELLTRCKDILFEPKRFMLPFEEELGGHPGFEAMRIHVAKEHKRPAFPVNMKQNEATQLLRETIEECWDTDSEARLSAVCVEERFKDVDNLMEAKCMPDMSKNDVSISFEKRKRLSSDSADVLCTDIHELSPLLETDTPASEKSTATTMTTLLQTPSEPLHCKPDVNIEMEKDRQLAPKQGRNIVAERNTLHSLDDDVELAVHENTLIPIEEAKARKAAEEERCRRLWEESQQQSQPDGVQNMTSAPAPRSVQLDVHNEVRAPATQRVKENNLNVRRHNSQRNLYESSTSSNGGPGMIVTIPDKHDPNKVVSRPKSLNIQQLNIKPEAS